MPEWERDCIAYKGLKKQLNLWDPQSRDEGFTQLLNNELVKMNDFFTRKEEEYTNNFQELRDEVANIHNREDARRAMIKLFRFHNKLNLLLLYYTLNCDGFIKIIKKHRKKTGGSCSFMQEDDHNPAFLANSLDELVAECEELLVHTANRI